MYMYMYMYLYTHTLAHTRVRTPVHSATLDLFQSPSLSCNKRGTCVLVCRCLLQFLAVCCCVGSVKEKFSMSKKSALKMVQFRTDYTHTHMCTHF